MLGYFGAAMGHLYVLGACMEYRIAKVIKKQGKNFMHVKETIG